jgi:hypothetical protein
MTTEHRVPSATMRGARARVTGWVVVGAYVALIGAVTVTHLQREPDRVPAPRGADAVSRFIDAWERSRQGTFVVVGTFERRSEVTGASITSEDILAQRPPQRLRRQLGGVDGRDDDRLLVCPAPPTESTEDAEPCRLGEGGGRSYDDDVEREVAGLHSILGGRDPLYGVTVADDGCFALDQRRLDPRAPFGIAARFCFDPATGAPAGSEVRYEGGIEEVRTVSTIRARVTEADLQP